MNSARNSPVRVQRNTRPIEPAVVVEEATSHISKYSPDGHGHGHGPVINGPTFLEILLLLDCALRY